MRSPDGLSGYPLAAAMVATTVSTFGIAQLDRLTMVFSAEGDIIESKYPMNHNTISAEGGNHEIRDNLVDSA